ncbi:MAG: GntR family transcriptional regulator [Acidimicrobiales bacterium]
MRTEPRRHSPRTASAALAPVRSRSADAFRYELVIDLVSRLIEEGGLQQGDKIPTNNELAEMAGVSLISVRRALDEMEREGRVRRHQGLGTFVAAAPIVTDSLRVGDLHATLIGEQSQMEITTDLLSVDQALPSETIAALLRITKDTAVWHVRRLRRIGDRSSVLEEAVVPVALAEDLDLDALRNGASLYGLLATAHGLVDASEEQFLGFGAASTEVCHALDLPPHAPVAHLHGVSFTTAGVPFDCFHHVYPATDFVFSMSSTTTRSILSPDGAADWSVHPLVPVTTQGRRQASSPTTH